MTILEIEERLTKINELNNIKKITANTSALETASRSIAKMNKLSINTSALETASRSIAKMNKLSINTSVLEAASRSIAQMDRLLINMSALEAASISIAQMDRLLINTSALEAASRSIAQISKLSINTSALEVLSKTIELYSNELTKCRNIHNNDSLKLSENEEMNMDINEVNEILLDEKLSIQEQLFKIWETFKNKNIFVLFLVWQLLISPILTPIKESYDKWVYESISSIVESIKDSTSYTDRKLLNKSIKKDVKNELTNNQDFNKTYVLNTYRFINCDSLNVREKDTTKSRIIYSLNRGDVVKIINKQKNWTKIQYRNRDETIAITGWVFTRYISRFD